MITSSRSRRHHDDGTFSDYVTFRFPANALRFLDVTPGRSVDRLRDVAHYRYVQARARGEASPVIVAFARLAHDRPANRLFPGLSTTAEDGERLFSANSFITYTMRTLFRRGWIRYEQDAWRPAVPPGHATWRRRAAAVLQFLSGRNHICLHTERRSPLDFARLPFSVDHNLVPLAPCGFLADYARHHEPDLIFNTAFFLLEHDDVIHRHAALGEAHSLWAAGGVIRRPPLFRRGAIWQYEDGSWRVGRLALDDLQICLPAGPLLTPRAMSPTGDHLPFALNEPAAAPVTLYTRYYGVARHGRVFGRTPADPERLELTVVDRRIVGLKEGGDLALPHNGFVISFAPGVLSLAARAALVHHLQDDLLLEYAFARAAHRPITQALQTGPILLQDGDSLLEDGYLEAEEQFWASRTLPTGERQIGVVPTNYKTDVDETRAGRAGLGIDGDGNFVLVMVAGVNEGMGVPGEDSFGATLSELAAALKEAGAHAALNLDGGGSTQAIYRDRRALVPGDRRGVTGRPYDRMVPAAGVVNEAG